MKRRILTLWVLGLALAAGALPAAGETKQPQAPASKPVTLEAGVDRSSITIGDPIVYSVTSRRDPKATLASPVNIPVGEPFEVKKVEDFRRNEDGRRVEGKRLTLTCFRLGDFVLAPASVAYRAADGSSGTAAAAKIYISVVSAQKGPPGQDIRPVKGVLAIAFKYGRLIAGVLLGMAVTLLALLLVLRRLQKKKPEELAPRSLLTPEDEALRGLHALFDSALLRQGRFRDYFFSLSEILRAYFEKRFLIFAAESTTDELIGLLKQKELERELVAQIQELLQAADLAKFAKWKPEAAEILRMNQQAEAIVKRASVLRA